MNPQTKGFYEEAHRVEEESALDADPCEGWEIGSYSVIRRLSAHSATRLLATRNDLEAGTPLVVLRHIPLGDASIQSFLTSSESIRQFRNDHVASVLDAEVTDEGCFWATEFIPGATLAEIRAACWKAMKSLPLGMAIGMVHEAALGLGALHASPHHGHGFVHPRNLLLSFGGTTKVLDAGLIRCFPREELRSPVLGFMAPYVPPEQVRSGCVSDPRADVYSLAVILYECISGIQLFPSTSFVERAARDSAEPIAPLRNLVLGRVFDEVILKALHPERTMRYANGLEFARALQKAAGEFIWRKPQRADFVGRLFATRKRRWQVLVTDGSIERRLALRSAPPVEEPTPPEAPRVPFLQVELVELPPPPPPESTLDVRKPELLAEVPPVWVDPQMRAESLPLHAPPRSRAPRSPHRRNRWKRVARWALMGMAALLLPLQSQLLEAAPASPAPMALPKTVAAPVPQALVQTPKNGSQVSVVRRQPAKKKRSLRSKTRRSKKRTALARRQRDPSPPAPWLKRRGRSRKAESNPLAPWLKPRGRHSAR